MKLYSIALESIDDSGCHSHVDCSLEMNDCYSLRNYCYKIVALAQEKAEVENQ